MSDADRTEAPTPKKLADARREGDVLQSRDLSTALVIFVGTVWVVSWGPGFSSRLGQMLRGMIQLNRSDLVAFSPFRSLWTGGVYLFEPIAILLVLTLLASFAAPALLGSLGFRLQATRFQPSRINPVSGLTRMFGGPAAAELAKSILKAGLIGCGCTMLLLGNTAVLSALSATGVTNGAAVAGSLIVQVLGLGSVLLGVIAVIDVPLQRQRRNKRLAMTREAVLREQREADGAPELKRERRNRQYALATMSARSAMADATVVLTNPAHFAVALRYDPDRDDAPVVVARGTADGAAAIRDLAKGRGVPTLEYPVLTRAIYFTSRVGSRVDQQLYLAVATVLAFVANLEAALAGGRVQPDIDVPETLRFRSDGVREA